MRYLEIYKLFESEKPLIEIELKDGNILRYKDEWKTSRSKERHDITKYLMDIFQELIDDGYVVNDGGWISSSDYPYIWLSSRRRRGGMDWDVVDDYISSAREYLESIGFITHIERLSKNQMYLYFDKDPKDFKSVSESVSSKNYLSKDNINNINDICLELVDDMSLIVTPHYYMKYKNMRYKNTERYSSTTSNDDGIVMMFIKMNIESAGDFKPFTINDDFIEVIDRLTEYVESIGWSCYVQFEDWNYKFDFDSSTFKPGYLKELKGLDLVELHFTLEME